VTLQVAERGQDEGLAVSLGRGLAGALLFSLPMLMTMEMWWLGFTVEPLRLALLCVLTFPLLVRLSRVGGLRRTQRLADDVADALVAVAVATAAAVLILWAFGEIGAGASAREAVGKVVLQAVPGSIGAALARNQLGSRSAEAERDEAGGSYGGELMLMGTGALFLSLNVAPTEEVVMIAHQIGVGREIALLALSLALMHAFVYSLEFRGTERRRPGEGFVGVLLRYTVVGYVLVMAVNLYVLWTFGRLEGLVPGEALSAMIVLGFPGAIGAAAARLLL
jgi:putative integral membrane protein (TIGR02587 family)